MIVSLYSQKYKQIVLSDNWDVLEKNDKNIRFIDVSGGNGGTDYLTIEKINFLKPLHHYKPTLCRFFYF